MRKALVLLLLGTITALLVISLPGCGQSSEDKALKYINRGDGYAYQMSGEAEKLSNVLDNFFTTLQGPNPEAVASPGGPIDQVSSALANVNSLASSTKAEYQGVLSLKGVEEEKEYATMMMDVADKTSGLMGVIEGWFNKVLEVLATMDARKIRAYLTGDEFKAGLAEIDGLRAEIEKIAGEARSYRLERDF